MAVCVCLLGLRGLESPADASPTKYPLNHAVDIQLAHSLKVSGFYLECSGGTFVTLKGGPESSFVSDIFIRKTAIRSITTLVAPVVKLNQYQPCQSARTVGELIQHGNTAGSSEFADDQGHIYLGAPLVSSDSLTWSNYCTLRTLIFSEPVVSCPGKVARGSKTVKFSHIIFFTGLKNG